VLPAAAVAVAAAAAVAQGLLWHHPGYCVQALQGCYQPQQRQEWQQVRHLLREPVALLQQLLAPCCLSHQLHLEGMQGQTLCGQHWLLLLQAVSHSLVYRASWPGSVGCQGLG
jgi:hypothetical protein